MQSWKMHFLPLTALGKTNFDRKDWMTAVAETKRARQQEYEAELASQLKSLAPRHS